MIREHGYRARSKTRTGVGSRGMKWTGVVVGSLATFLIILTLGVAIGFVLATMFALLGMEVSVASGLVGVSLTLLLAFFLGGYVAGRTACRSGARHGLLVVLLALVGVMFPSTLDDVQNLSAIMPIFGVLSLILPFVGGAAGGVRGAKMSRKKKP